MKRLSRSGCVTATLALAACVPNKMPLSGSAGCAGTVENNRAVVLDFYRDALIERQPQSAFARFVAPGFVEHKPDVPQGTRDATARYLEELIAGMPDPRWEILSTVAEGDKVFLHAKFTPAPNAPAYAIADLFRLEECRIVEHWDVVAGPPDEQVNPNPRF